MTATAAMGWATSAGLVRGQEAAVGVQGVGKWLADTYRAF